MLLYAAACLTGLSVQFDFFDHRRFCNMHFEAYDIVDAEIERR